jgi:filamentous hemagglutinin
VNIRATGDDDNSNVVIQGSTVNAGHTVDLQADNKVQLLAAQNTASQTSRNSSSSGSVGITFGTSGFGVTAAASQGKGSIDGQDTSYSNTHVQGSQVNIKSGGDTDIKGAVVTANTVKADIKGKFNVESLQDTSTYKEASKSIGGSVTIGPAANFSLNASKTDINSNYASVAEQSGIRAGDGGFQVNVRGASDLKGGAVTSTQKAVDAGTNVFNSAGGITTSDIQNSASYKGSGYSVGASIGMGTDPAGHSVPGGSAGVGSQSGTAGRSNQTVATVGALNRSEKPRG